MTRWRSDVRTVLAGGVTGFAILGVGGRVAMAALPLFTGARPRVSWGGSLEVVLLGFIYGVCGGVLLALLRRTGFVTLAAAPLPGRPLEHRLQGSRSRRITMRAADGHAIGAPAPPADLNFLALGAVVPSRRMTQHPTSTRGNSSSRDGDAVRAGRGKRVDWTGPASTSRACVPGPVSRRSVPHRRNGGGGERRSQVVMVVPLAWSHRRCQPGP